MADLEREIVKQVPDFVQAVWAVMSKKFLDRDGHIIGTQKIWGYVCKIHDQEDDELYGTVDVQEFDYDYPEGFHEGVQLGALQNNSNAQVVIPKLYSDVVIAQDPNTLVEYIVMTSHVDDIQMKSHVSTTVGVAETEEFEEGDDGPDIHELEETGNFSKSSYDKDRIKHHYKSKDGDDIYSEYNKSHIIHKVSSSAGETTIEQLGDKVLVTAKDSKITINADGTVDIKAKKINIEGSTSLDTKSPKTTIDGNKVEVTGAQFIRKGTSNLDGMGGFCGIPVCPFTGSPHTGSIISGGQYE